MEELLSLRSPGTEKVFLCIDLHIQDTCCDKKWSTYKKVKWIKAVDLINFIQSLLYRFIHFYCTSD